jgi:ribosomal protein S18 acetylase RimI-like enzyme
MVNPYQIIARVATIGEYRNLCTAVGWAEVMNFEAAKTALPNSLYGVVAIYEDKVVGMGRVVGDGAIFYYIQDVAVLPQHQGKGIGKAIVSQLVAYIRECAPPQAFLGVFAAQGKESFYQRYGFHEDPVLTGMFQVIPPHTPRDAQ